MSNTDGAREGQGGGDHHVDECPNCETRFVGMTADEFREDHAPECNPLLKLLRFTGEIQ